MLMFAHAGVLSIRINIDAIGALKIEASRCLTDAGTPRSSLFIHSKDRQTGLIAAFPEVGSVSIQHASGALHSSLSAPRLAPRFIQSGIMRSIAFRGLNTT